MLKEIQGIEGKCLPLRMEVEKSSMSEVGWKPQVKKQKTVRKKLTHMGNVCLPLVIACVSLGLLKACPHLKSREPETQSVAV